MNLKELEAKALACIADFSAPYRQNESSLQNPSPGHFALTITQEYEYVDVQFDDLLKLSELFSTKKINIGDKYGTQGCETCNYGSRYELTIHMLDSPVKVTG